MYRQSLNIYIKYIKEVRNPIYIKEASLTSFGNNIIFSIYLYFFLVIFVYSNNIRIYTIIFSFLKHIVLYYMKLNLKIYQTFRCRRKFSITCNYLIVKKLSPSKTYFLNKFNELRNPKSKKSCILHPIIFIIFILRMLKSKFF